MLYTLARMTKECRIIPSMVYNEYLLISHAYTQCRWPVFAQYDSTTSFLSLSSSSFCHALRRRQRACMHTRVKCRCHEHFFLCDFFLLYSHSTWKKRWPSSPLREETEEEENKLWMNNVLSSVSCAFFFVVYVCMCVCFHSSVQRNPHIHTLIHKERKRKRKTKEQDEKIEHTQLIDESG